METKELGLLNKLSPAETHYLIDGEFASFNRLLQLTLVDLHFKQVLCLKTGINLDAPSGKSQDMIKVSLGKGFKAYKAKKHEQPFIEIFNDETDIEYLLTPYVKVLKEYIGKENKFIKNMLLKSVDLEPLFHSASWRDFFLPRKLTERGLAEQGLQKKNLNLLNRHLPALIEKQPAKAMEILNIITGNVLLLDAVDQKLLKSLSKESFKREEGTYLKKEGFRSYEGIGSDSLLFDHQIDHYINVDDSVFDPSFESGFDAADGGGGCGSSGCSSGCSACGGCGGCGH